jgi:protease IV
MKNKWLWLWVAVPVGMIVLFVVSVYIASLLLGEKGRFVTGGGVGLLEVRGPILESQEVIRQIHELNNDANVKTVVLRIESPGGGVGPSQEIYEEIKKLAERKKVVVSMGSVAASGGYYIAAPAAVIYANPGTITGSIGVLMKFTNMEGLMGKVGMKAYTLKSGQFKDIGSPVRPMTEQDQLMLQGVIDSTYGQFVAAVAEGRKLPVEEVKVLADGRIYTGEQAKTLKLVDKLGNLEDAVAEAGRLAGLKGEPQLIRPSKKKKLLLDMLVEESAGKIGNLVKWESGISVNYELDGFIK